MKLFSSRITQAKEAVRNIKRFDPLVPDIQVFRFGEELPYSEYPYDEHTRHGIDKDWLSLWVNADNWDSGAIIIHDPLFNIKNAHGWYTRINGIPVLQAFAQQDRPHPRMGVSHLEYVLLHEILHFLYRKERILDRTHYWDYERSDFKGAFDEIRQAQPTMLMRWINALANTIKETDEIYDVPWTVHHTGNVNHTIQGLLNSNTYKDRPVFYNVIIDKQGQEHHFHDKPNRRGKGLDYNVAVLGDYTKELPTDAVVETLNDFLKDKEWLTHKQLADLGLATKSQCPGNLTNYVQM